MQTLAIGDARLQVFDRGAGPPIVLVHGFPLDHSMWQAQIDFLANDWRVIAPDLRGFGGSSLGAGAAGVTSMQQMAEDVHAMLDALDLRQPVVFCGLSLGGYVAWQFVRLFRPRLRALVLCDTRSKADTPEGVQSRMKMVEHVLRAGTQYVAEAMLPKLFSPDTFANNAACVEFVRRKILAASPPGIAAALRGLAIRPDATPWLSAIDLPTLCIVGEHDAISPVAEMRAMAAAIPNAQIRIIENAGHMTPLERPGAFNALLGEFLAGV